MPCFIENHEVHFPSGLVAAITRNTIGLHPVWLESDGYDIAYGPDDSPEHLTHEDLVALADMMIEGWTAFRAKHAALKD